MDEEKLKKNIIRVLIVFSLAFLTLIGYLSYFEIRYGETIVSSPYNIRNKDRENEILRGTIYDRAMGVIVDSRREDDNTPRRIYKKGLEQPYAPIIGYYSQKYGKSALELNYTNDLLDMSLNPFKVIKDILTKADRKGNNLVLTTDSDLQKLAYDLLGDNKGAVVAMDPKTGEILCMVSKPVFNPLTIDKDWEKLIKQNEEGLFLNRAIQPGLYPPGSTFKIITVSKAIENISNIENKTYSCSGSIKIGNYTLNDYGSEKHGRINLHDALVESCNVTFGQVGIELGVDRLKSGAEDFYFNKSIPFDLQVSQSQFPAIEKNRPDSLAQSAIGQHEVTVTPIHMALVVSSVANDGVMMNPYIVKYVTDSYGWNVKQTKPSVLSQPIKKETADKVKNMMIDVVKEGTGKSARISGVEVAGKTGTADVKEGMEPHSWFVGFAPAQNPQIAVAVIVENGGVGGGKAANIFREIIRAYLKK